MLSVSLAKYLVHRFNTSPQFQFLPTDWLGIEGCYLHIIVIILYEFKNQDVYMEVKKNEQ